MSACLRIGHNYHEINLQPDGKQSIIFALWQPIVLHCLMFHLLRFRERKQNEKNCSLYGRPGHHFVHASDSRQSPKRGRGRGAFKNVLH